MLDQMSTMQALAPFGKMIVPESKGLTLADFVYANTQDLTSTALIPITAGVIAKDASAALYSSSLGQVGQGWTTPATLGQTNSNFTKGQAPKNQVFVALFSGFEIFFEANGTDPGVAGGLTEALLAANQVFSVGTNFSWTLQLGDGNLRNLGALLDYPGSQGGWAGVGDDPAPYFVSAQNGLPGLAKRQLSLPIVFPPLIPVTFNTLCGNSFTVATSGVTANLGIRMFLQGVLMTQAAPQN